MAEIRLQQVAHSYRDHPQTGADYALRPSDHVWRDGGAYALLGPSGCGKTTLLNIISGLLRPSQGRVLFNGEDMTTRPTRERNIAQVFQFPVIYDAMTVYENLAFPLRNRKLPKAHIDKRVREVAAMLELGDCLSQRARRLSPDLKQMISLGRGLVRQDVAAILFDEPLTVIDPQLKFQLRRKLKQIHERFQLTLIYVTHDQSEALTFADEVVVMRAGEVLQTDTPEDLFERPSQTFVGHFIGNPGMNFLACEQTAGQMTLAGRPLQVRDAVAGTPPFLSNTVQVGIRPEYIQLATAAGDNVFPVTINDIEDLGNYQILTADLAGQTVKVKLEEGRPVTTGANVIYLPPEKTQVYVNDRRIG